MSTTAPVYADVTATVGAKLEAHAGCTNQDVCLSASCTVTMTAECAGADCEVTATHSCINPCDPGRNIPATALWLYNSYQDCTGTYATDDPTPVDLLPPGTFTLSLADWDAMFGGSFLIVAEVGDDGAGAMAAVSGSTTKRRIPAVSSWGVVGMAGLVVIAGSIVLRRRRAPA